MKLLLSIFVIFSLSSYAHPGRTNSHGCHTCRTNCSYWGKVTGSKHCHNQDFKLQFPDYMKKNQVKPRPSNILGAFLHGMEYSRNESHRKEIARLQRKRLEAKKRI
jgi:hypothetical protein